MKELTKEIEFKKLKKELTKEVLASSQISVENFIKAKTNISVMIINNVDDAFLYFASLNLLNAYIKQNKNAISYSFKSCITTAFDKIIEKQIPATFCYDENEKLLIVNINGIQFSFHSVFPSVRMNFVKDNLNMVKVNYFKEQKWEGIRLQPFAEKLFEFANNLCGLSGKSIAGSLKKVYKSVIAN